MSNITNIYALPNDILAEIFNYAGETNIGPVCTLWNEVYQNTLHDGLKASLGFTCSDSNINTSTTTKLVKHLFQQATQSGTKEEADEIIHSDAPLHMKLSKIQECNERAQIHAYHQFIKRIDPTTKDALASIEEQQLSFTQELKELKELLNSLNLQDLTELYLQSTQLIMLPPEIGNLQNLKKIIFSSSQLTILPPEIGNLKVLTELYLSLNKLTILPPEIGGLQALIVINLSNNKLKTLLPEIGNLQALTQLDLSFNKLTTTSTEISNLQNLRKLNLSFNQLTGIPPEIGNLKALEELKLDSNSLRTIPPEIGKLQALMKISLSCNKLKTLPAEIGNLQHLFYLSLGSNSLATIPKEIGSLRALESLYLEKNQLTMIPPEIGNLQALTMLSFEENQLTTIPPEISNLQALECLNLSNNQLTTLPPELVKLNIFPNIEGNPIEYLPSQFIAKIGENFKSYAFDLSSDMQKLLDLQNGKSTFEDMPIRLQNLMNQFYDLQLLLSKMQELDALKANFITSKSLDVLVQILNFPTDSLHEQQIVEVVLELFSNLEEAHPLKLEINQVVATALGLDLEEEPEIGLEKFLFRPLNPEIKQAVLALQSNDNSSSPAYALLSKEKEKNANLAQENSLLTQENTSLKQEGAKVPALENAIQTQELKLEQAKEYQEALEADSKKEKEGLQSEISSLKEQLLEKEEKDIYQKRKAAFLTAGIKIFSQNELLKHLSMDFNEQYWNQMKLVYKDIDFEAIEQKHPLSNN